MALPFSAAASVALYYTLLPIYRRGASPIILMMASMAYNVILLGVLNAAADYFGRAWAVFTRGYTLKSADFHIAHIQGLAVAGPLIMVAVAFSLYLLKSK